MTPLVHSPDLFHFPPSVSAPQWTLSPTNTPAGLLNQVPSRRKLSNWRTSSPNEQTASTNCSSRLFRMANFITPQNIWQSASSIKFGSIVSATLNIALTTSSLKKPLHNGLHYTKLYFCQSATALAHTKSWPETLAKRSSCRENSRPKT